MEIVADPSSLKTRTRIPIDMSKLELLLVLLYVEKKDFLVLMPEWTILISGISSMIVLMKKIANGHNGVAGQIAMRRVGIAPNLPDEVLYERKGLEV